MTLDDLSAEIVVEGQSVSCSGATRYGALAEALKREGLALGNLASLPHITVTGAVAMATHGSGDTNGNLGTSVGALELITSDGELVHRTRGDEDFDGVVVCRVGSKRRDLGSTVVARGGGLRAGPQRCAAGRKPRRAAGRSAELHCAGATLRVGALAQGEHGFECLIQPWMRVVVERVDRAS